MAPSPRKVCCLVGCLMLVNPVTAQTYNEVQVYGWGLAINEGAPAFADIDGDGKMDLLVGNSTGTLWHLEQVTGNDFKLIDQFFNQIDVHSQAVPLLADIDHDGLFDLIVGMNDGIERFEQESVNSYLFREADQPLVQTDIGARWAPAMADFNGDGLLDLIIGESLGNLNYFVQDSIAAGTFSLVTENWLGWDGGTYVAPHFTDLDGNGSLDLLIGESIRKLFHLAQDSLHAATFTQVTNAFGGIEPGYSAVPAVIDIDHDGKLDLFTGEWYNGLYHHEQADSGSEMYTMISDNVLGVRDFGANIGYTVDDIDHDGSLDLLVSGLTGANEIYIRHLEQDLPGSLQFTVVNEQFNGIPAASFEHLTLYDINHNGLLDLFVGSVDGYVARYEQDAFDSDGFTLKEEFFNNKMTVNQTPQLAFADIDGDSLLDMIAGEGQGRVLHYEQDSLNALTFTLKTSQFLTANFGYYTSPVFTDLDGDSLLDLVIGSRSGSLSCFEQDSVRSENFILQDNPFGSVVVTENATPRFADVNGDGRTDLLVGDNMGGITLHLRNEAADLTPPDRPQNLSTAVDGNQVILTWNAVQAKDVMLYNIYRSTLPDTLTANYLNSVAAPAYVFTDTTLHTSGKYYYWITALDSVGNESGFSIPDSIDIVISGNRGFQSVARAFRIGQNYPNPFNPATVIEFQLPEPEFVTLKVYDISGRETATILAERMPAGLHTCRIDAGSWPSGVYYYRITAGAYRQTRRMVLTK